MIHVHCSMIFKKLLITINREKEITYLISFYQYQADLDFSSLGVAGIHPEICITHAAASSQKAGVRGAKNQKKSTHLLCKN